MTFSQRAQNSKRKKDTQDFSSYLPTTGTISNICCYQEPSFLNDHRHVGNCDGNREYQVKSIKTTKTKKIEKDTFIFF